MTRKKWYVISLWLPFIIPLLGLALAGLKPDLLGKTMQDTIVILSMASGLLWLPYLLFLLFVLRWARNKPAAAISRASWVMPAAFYPFTLLFIPYMYYQSNPAQVSLAGFLKSLYEMGIFFLPFCLGIGYLYVLLAHMLTLILARSGMIRD